MHVHVCQQIQLSKFAGCFTLSEQLCPTKTCSFQRFKLSQTYSHYLFGLGIFSHIEIFDFREKHVCMFSNLAVNKNNKRVCTQCDVDCRVFLTHHL